MAKDWKKIIIDGAKDKHINILSILPNKVSRTDNISFECLMCSETATRIIRSIIEKNLWTCKKCTNINKHNKRKNTCMKKYGTEHPMQNVTIKAKVETTTFERYGVRNAAQSDITKKKIKETCIRKYGTEHPMKSTIVKEKFENTCIEKYGVVRPLQNKDVLEKSIKTCIKNYGVENPMFSKDVKKRFVETSMRKYGTKHPIQNKDVYANRKKYKVKKYIFTTGECVYVQGYEPQALEILERQNYTCNDIEIEGISIDYKFEGKWHKHFPDIYIPKERRIIEVKSIYTYEADYEKNKQKQHYGIKCGFKYEFWIMDETKLIYIR